MEYTHIPHLEKKVSRIGLGTWAIGGWLWGGTDVPSSIAAIHSAWDRGINLIDTAPAYGFGRSEEIVGKALKQYGKRDKVIIATKHGLSWKNEQTVYRDSRKKTILKEVESSLKRLGVDYIDLYQTHWPDTRTPFAETAETLHELLKQGKIRAIGVCNFSVEQMQAFQKGGPLHSLQDPFNLFESWIEHNELAFAMNEKLAVLGYGSLCRGLLSGKMSKQRVFKGDDLRKSDPKFQEPHFSEYLRCIEQLKKWVEKKHHRPLLALAVRWSLDKGTNVALWGARKPDQLNDLDNVWGWKLSAEDFAEIDQIMKETITHPVEPGNMGPPARE